MIPAIHIIHGRLVGFFSLFVVLIELRLTVGHLRAYKPHSNKAKGLFPTKAIFECEYVFWRSNDCIHIISVVFELNSINLLQMINLLNYQQINLYRQKLL